MIDRPTIVVHEFRQRAIIEQAKIEGRYVPIYRPHQWGNPFSHLPSSTARWRVATREESIRRFEEWIVTQSELMAKIGELHGKVLGCFCMPYNRCHGEVLARLAAEAVSPSV